MIVSNPRYLLRAYSNVDAARLAVLLRHNVGASRQELAEAWFRWHPEHAVRTKITRRITRGVGLLRTAGIIEADEHTIKVLDHALLAMVARNCAILQDGAGVAVAPSQWARRPEVPPSLQAAQRKLYPRSAAA